MSTPELAALITIVPILVTTTITIIHPELVLHLIEDHHRRTQNRRYTRLARQLLKEGKITAAEYAHQQADTWR